MLKLQLEMQLGYHLKKKPDFAMGFPNENDLHKKKKKKMQRKKNSENWRKKIFE